MYVELGANPWFAAKSGCPAEVRRLRGALATRFASVASDRSVRSVPWLRRSDTVIAVSGTGWRNSMRAVRPQR